jgi:hypothetical protein
MPLDPETVFDVVGEAIAAEIRLAGDTGYVATRERESKSDEDFPKLFMEMNAQLANAYAGKPYGWMVQPSEFDDTDEGGIFKNTLTLIYNVECIRAFADKLPGGKKGGIEFGKHVMKVCQRLRVNRSLGFADNNVRHKLLKTVTPFIVRKWDEDGEITTFYVALRIEVEVTLYVEQS